MGWLPLAELRAEIHAQLAAFRAATGSAPKFIDGHHHVHQLPGLRTIVLDLVEHVQPAPAVRNTRPLLGPGFRVKQLLITNTGARALARELAQRAVAHNPVLLGAYDFHETDYQALMQGWLAALPDRGGLLFCHPGEVADGDPTGRYAAARLRELAYLESDLFPRDLAAANVTLGRVWRIAQAPSTAR